MRSGYKPTSCAQRIVQAVQHQRRVRAQRNQVRDHQLMVEFWINQIHQSTDEGTRALYVSKLHKAQLYLQQAQDALNLVQAQHLS